MRPFGTLEAELVATTRAPKIGQCLCAVGRGAKLMERSAPESARILMLFLVVSTFFRRVEVKDGPGLASRHQGHDSRVDEGANDKNLRKVGGKTPRA